MCPLVQIRVSDLVAGGVVRLDLEAVSSGSVDFNVAVDGYNRLLVVWEPVLEPSTMRLGVALNPTGLEFSAAAAGSSSARAAGGGGGGGRGDAGSAGSATREMDVSTTNAGTPAYRFAKLYVTVESAAPIELCLTASFLQSILGVVRLFFISFVWFVAILLFTHLSSSFSRRPFCRCTRRSRSSRCPPRSPRRAMRRNAPPLCSSATKLGWGSRGRFKPSTRRAKR